MKLIEIVCIEKVLDRTVQKYVQALYGEKTEKGLLRRAVFLFFLDGLAVISV